MNQNIEVFVWGEEEVRRKKWKVILVQGREMRAGMGVGVCAEGSVWVLSDG